MRVPVPDRNTHGDADEYRSYTHANAYIYTIAHRDRDPPSSMLHRRIGERPAMCEHRPVPVLGHDLHV